MDNIVKLDPPPPPPPPATQQQQHPQPHLSQNHQINQNLQHPMQHQVLQEQQRLMPMHMIQRDDHIVTQQPPVSQPSPATVHEIHNGQMFTGMRRDFMHSHHGQTLHHMPPVPSNIDMHGKMEMPHWMHPIVQHS